MNMFQRKSSKLQEGRNNKTPSDSLGVFQSEFANFELKILDKHPWRTFFPKTQYTGSYDSSRYEALDIWKILIQGYSFLLQTYICQNRQCQFFMSIRRNSNLKQQCKKVKKRFLIGSLDLQHFRFQIYGCHLTDFI